jgi:hypothetical protein
VSPVPPVASTPSTPGTFETTLRTNLTGTLLCTRAAFAWMAAHGGGRIINNGSIAAHAPRAGAAAYAASKAAVASLTVSTALDGRDVGITATELDIGNARTALLDTFTTECRIRTYLRRRRGGPTAGQRGRDAGQRLCGPDDGDSRRNAVPRSRLSALALVPAPVRPGNFSLFRTPEYGGYVINNDRPSTAPDFLLSRASGSIRTQGTRASFPDPFEAATALRDGSARLVVGAVPFDTA